MQTGYQLRRLFNVILTQCSPLDPAVLWEQFASCICDDLAHKLRTSFGVASPTDSEINDYGLYLLNDLLQETGKSLSDYPPMPLPVKNWSTTGDNRLIWEHRQLQRDTDTAIVHSNVERLNPGQRRAFDAITTSVLEAKGTTFFLNGGAGRST